MTESGSQPPLAPPGVYVTGDCLLRLISEAVVRTAEAESSARKARRERDDLIREAFRREIAPRFISRAAAPFVGRARLYQIRDGKR